MSAFLGPIHFWLYNKIQIQQDIVEDIFDLSKDIVPTLREAADESFGITERRPLEDAIDQSNIHGWLQSQIIQVEYKLAFSVITLKEERDDVIEKIEKIFYAKGGNIASNQSIDSAAQAYKLLSDSLLDGMPCDHANSLIEEGDAQVIWKRNTCVHTRFWEEMGGDIHTYYQLREAFIKGLLSETAFEFEKIDETTYRIQRGEI